MIQYTESEEGASFNLEDRQTTIRVARMDNGDPEPPHWVELHISKTVMPAVGGRIELTTEIDLSQEEAITLAHMILNAKICAG